MTKNSRCAEDEFNLSSAKIAIIGLGLMGGSLALALRGKCDSLFGIDPDEKTRRLALDQHIVDAASADPAQLLPQADMLILAAPVPAILTLLEDLPRWSNNPLVVMDIGSSKAQILQRMERLPANFDPIGGHPICGKEKLTLENADRTLYYGAPFILTPLARSTARARSAADQLLTVLGAKKIQIDATEHDRILAHTSHTPYLLSSALALATPEDAAGLIGPGFRSSSRLAGTPSSMMLGVLLSNRENVLAVLERVQDELALLTSALYERDLETLQSSLDAARAAYIRLIKAGE